MTSVPSISSRFKRRIKRVSIGIGAGLLILIAGMVIFISLSKEELLRKMIGQVNEQQAGEIEVAATDVAIFEFFPNVALEVIDLNYFEHARKERPKSEIPVLHAEKLFLTLNIWKLVVGSDLEVVNIGLRNATITLVENAEGDLNLARALESKKSGTHPGELTISLESIEMDSVAVIWQSRAHRKPAVFLIDEAHASLDYSSDIISSTIESTVDLKRFYALNRYFRDEGQLTSEVGVTYDKKAKKVTLHSGIVKFKGASGTVTGSYDHTNGRLLDMAFEGTFREFTILKSLIKEDIINLNKELLQKGRTDLKGRIFGKLSEGLPQWEVSIASKDISLVMPGNLGEFRSLGFDGSARSGGKDDLSEAVVEIRHLTGKIPGGSVSGQFYVQNFVQPYVRYNFDASARIDHYDRIFDLKKISNLTGILQVHADFEGNLDIGQQSPPTNATNGVLTISNVGFTYGGSKKVSSANGRVVLANRSLTSDNLRFQYQNSPINTGFQLSQVYRWLFHEDEPLLGNFTIDSDRMFLRDFISDSTRKIDDPEKVQVHAEAVFETTSSKSNDSIPEVPGLKFSITKFSADFDELPDISTLTATGQLTGNASGLVLKVWDIRSRLLNGSILLDSATATVNKEEIYFNGLLSFRSLHPVDLNPLFARLKKVQAQGSAFFSPEIKEITAGMNVGASLQRHPFRIKDFTVTHGNVDLLWGSRYRTRDLWVHLHDLQFPRVSRDSAVRVKPGLCEIQIPNLELPGFGRTSFSLSAEGTDPGMNFLSLNRLVCNAESAKGGLNISGGATMPDQNTLKLDIRLVTEKFKPGQSRKAGNTDDPDSDFAAELHLKASLSLSPFTVVQVDAEQGHSEISLGKSGQLKTGNFKAHATNLSFYKTPSSSIGIQSLTGQVSFDSLHIPGLFGGACTLSGNVVQNIGRFDFTTDIFDAAAETGKLSLDLNSKPLSYQFIYSLDKMPTGYISKLLYNKALMTGSLDVKLDLQGFGTDSTALRRLNGNLSVHGSNLILAGVDLDKFLKKYEKSQNFDLVDVTAFVVYGAVGAAVTKGSDFVNLLITDTKKTDATRIGELSINCSANKGVITTQDVALSTQESRIAVEGQLDFLKKTIPGMTVSVVDKKGCSLLNQRFYGDLKHIQHGKLNVAGTLTGSITNLANTIVGNECKVVYAGSVKHPK